MYSISDTDCCTICNKPYKHKQYNIMLPIDVDLVEICFKTAHAKCEQIYKKCEILKSKLLDAEFELFLLKYNKKN